MIPGFRRIRRDEPKPDPRYDAYLKRRLGVKPAELDLSQLMLIGPAAGEELRALVYGVDPQED